MLPRGNQYDWKGQSSSEFRIRESLGNTDHMMEATGSATGDSASNDTHGPLSDDDIQRVATAVANIISRPGHTPASTGTSAAGLGLPTRPTTSASSKSVGRR